MLNPLHLKLSAVSAKGTESKRRLTKKSGRYFRAAVSGAPARHIAAVDGAFQSGSFREGGANVGMARIGRKRDHRVRAFDARSGIEAKLPAVAGRWISGAAQRPRKEAQCESQLNRLLLPANGR